MKEQNQAYHAHSELPEKGSEEPKATKKRTFTRFEKLMSGQVKKVEKNVERFQFLLQRYAF